MKVMCLDQAGYTYELCGQSRTHEQWLSRMRFGLTALLDQQDVIQELIYEEACKLSSVSGMKPWAEVGRIFEELGLKIALDDNAEG